jgi:hypothetical protein
MRVLIYILMVMSLLVSGMAGAMHIHSDVGPASAVVHGMGSPGDAGTTTASHAAICHSCAHHSPSTLAIPRVGTLSPMADRPLARDSMMALGGAWPPLAKPPR